MHQVACVKVSVWALLSTDSPHTQAASVTLGALGGTDAACFLRHPAKQIRGLVYQSQKIRESISVNNFVVVDKKHQ